MILFTLDEIRVFVRVLAEELQDRGPRLNQKELMNADSELYGNVIERFIRQMEVVDNDRAGAKVDSKQQISKTDPRLPDPINPQNMGVEETAQYLRVSINTLYKWTSQGSIPHSKVGTKKLSFCRKDLDQFLATRRVAGDLDINQRASDTAGRLRNDKG